MIILETLLLLFILIAAAVLLSYGAESIAEKYGANFAGSVILAFVTTLPEYMFVFWAAVKGEYAVAVGSAVGAAMMLITLGYGLVIFTATTMSRKPVKVIELSQTTRIDALYLILTALAALVLAIENNGFDLKDGIILTALFGIYVYHHARGAVEFGEKHKIEVPKEELLKGLAYLGIGGAIIIAASERFVEVMIQLAHEFGISPVTIAIIIGPLASELPEKLTAFVTIMRDGKLAEISVCNFIGSKVNHNSLLLGTLPIIAFFSAGSAVHGIVTPQFMAMTLLTFVAGASLARRKLEKWQGLVFVALYSIPVYVALIAT